MPGGESFRDIQGRFVPFIDTLLAEGSASDCRTILVAHGGLYLAMLPVILTNIDHAFARRHGFPYTAHVAAEVRPQGLRCLSWCGVLTDG